jgi:dihydrofolate reductase
MKIHAIVACGLNGGIGLNDQLPWRLPADLAHFKQQTWGHCLLMGRKTYASVGKPLPGRTTLVISRQADLAVPEGVVVVHSVAEAIEAARQRQGTILWVVGGAEIYRLAMPFVEILELTLVHTSPEADAFFDLPNDTDWQTTAKVFRPADDKNPFDMEFITYQKRQ